jgi:K+-transporting ATPase ATPase C chain
MKLFITSIKVFLFFTILTGIIYPLSVTVFAKLFFPGKSEGSIIYRNNVAVGSALIGQQFDTSIYFSSRPSAINYNPLPSGGSNLGMSNSKLKDSVSKRIDRFILSNHLDSTVTIPSEMVYSSASGIDPHISFESAILQESRVASGRHFNARQKKELSDLIRNHTEPPQYNLFGEKRINVLLLNLDLDTIK